MLLRQKMLAAIFGIIILYTIVQLVRNKKLREEFSWLWIITGISIFILGLWSKGLELLSFLIGAVLPISTLFFCGIIFLVCISLHFSVKVSELTDKTKNLAQKIALLEATIQEINDKKKDF